MKTLLVNVAVWVSVAAWFVGAFVRVLAPKHQPSDGKRLCEHEVWYRASWLLGAAALLVHIVASYGFVHHWSHADALAATAAESKAVTGVSAPWGVYVNFVFASTWLAYSLFMIVWRRRSLPFDNVFFAFATVIVFSATVVFETGLIRILSATAFAGLIGLWIRKRYWAR